MDYGTTAALLAGGFALAGGLGGALLTGMLSRGGDARRLRAEDQRRWLTDRRRTYAAFLGLASSMLDQIDGIAVFLSYDGDQPLSDDDEEVVSDGLFEYISRWNEELQPALGEVELLASPRVADLADRVTSALMHLTANVELRGSFIEHSPTWFQTRDLADVLRNAMREELGLQAMPLDQRIAARRSDGWPWLPDRPPRESYIQGQVDQQP